MNTPSAESVLRSLTATPGHLVEHGAWLPLEVHGNPYFEKRPSRIASRVIDAKWSNHPDSPGAYRITVERID